MERHYLEFTATSNAIYCVAEEGDTCEERIEKIEKTYNVRCADMHIDAELSPSASRIFQWLQGINNNLNFRVRLEIFRYAVNVMLEEGRHIAVTELPYLAPIDMSLTPRYPLYRGDNADALFDEILESPEDLYEVQEITLNRNQAFQLLCSMIREGIAQRWKEVVNNN